MTEKSCLLKGARNVYFQNRLLVLAAGLLAAAVGFCAPFLEKEDTSQPYMWNLLRMEDGFWAALAFLGAALGGMRGFCSPLPQCGFKKREPEDRRRGCCTQCHGKRRAVLPVSLGEHNRFWGSRKISHSLPIQYGGRVRLSADLHPAAVPVCAYKAEKAVSFGRFSGCGRMCAFLCTHVPLLEFHIQFGRKGPVTGSFFMDPYTGELAVWSAQQPLLRVFAA